MKRQLTALLAAMLVVLSLLGASVLAADSPNPASGTAETETDQQLDTDQTKEEAAQESSAEEQATGEEAAEGWPPSRTRRDGSGSVRF